MYATLKARNVPLYVRSGNIHVLYIACPVNLFGRGGVAGRGARVCVFLVHQASRETTFSYLSLAKLAELFPPPLMCGFVSHIYYTRMHRPHAQVPCTYTPPPSPSSPAALTCRRLQPIKVCLMPTLSDHNDPEASERTYSSRIVDALIVGFTHSPGAMLPTIRPAHLQSTPSGLLIATIMLLTVAPRHRDRSKRRCPGVWVCH